MLVPPPPPHSPFSSLLQSDKPFSISGLWQDFKDDLFYQEAAFIVLDWVNQDVVYESDTVTVVYHLPDAHRFTVLQKSPAEVPELANYFMGLPPFTYPYLSLQKWLLKYKFDELRTRMYNMELGSPPTMTTIR